MYICVYANISAGPLWATRLTGPNESCKIVCHCILYSVLQTVLLSVTARVSRHPEKTFYHHPGTSFRATRILQLLSQKSVKMMIRIAFWSSQVFPSGRTEVLTKGGTSFLGASRALEGLPWRPSTSVSHNG